MKTNELKKGIQIKLRNGWNAEIKDNMRGDIRMALVFGTYTETGSVYSHDIMTALTDNGWVDIEHTPAQLKLKETVNNLF